MKVFFDTSVFIALFVSQDSSHKQTTKKYQEYRKERAQLFTSYYILDELFTRLLYDFGENVAQKKVKEINDSVKKEELKILDIDQLIFSKSQEVFIKFAEHKLSFTDATTYILYKDFAIDEVFTLDSDFKKVRVKTSF